MWCLFEQAFQGLDRWLICSFPFHWGVCDSKACEVVCCMLGLVGTAKLDESDAIEPTHLGCLPWQASKVACSVHGAVLTPCCISEQSESWISLWFLLLFILWCTWFPSIRSCFEAHTWSNACACSIYEQWSDLDESYLCCFSLFVIPSVRSCMQPMHMFDIWAVGKSCWWVSCFWPWGLRNSMLLSCKQYKWSAVSNVPRCFLRIGWLSCFSLHLTLRCMWFQASKVSWDIITSDVFMYC